MSVLRSRLAVAVLPVLLLSACGGGGGGGNKKSLRLEAAFDRSGEIFGDGTVLNLPAALGILYAGDNNTGVLLVDVVSILLAPIPAGATIDSATLEIRATLITGDPYTQFGTFVMDHFDVESGLGFEDFSGPSLTYAYRTLPPLSMGTVSTVTLDVTSAIGADRTAGRLTSSFRFHFTSSPPGPNAQSDLVGIYADPNTTTTLPHVNVTYH